MMRRSIPLVFLLYLLACCAPRSYTGSFSRTNELIPTDIPILETPFHAVTVLRYAKAFSVEYHSTYKVLTVLNPWRNAPAPFTYYLVQRGTPIPYGIGNALVIEIPVKRIASLATTHLPYLEALNDLDSLVAVGNAEYVNTTGVNSGLEKGSIQSVGNGPDVNIEKLLEVNPEVITTLALGNSGKDDYQILLQKGLKPVIFSDYMEESPLARAEWIKFMALFFNQEEQAETIFNEVEERYLKMKVLTEKVTNRPTVLLGYEINGNWNMPGGLSYQATYVKDAGGSYLWAEDTTSGRIPMSFEAVLEKGLDSDYWFDQSLKWKSADDFLGADTRYADFRSFKENHVYNNNARLSSGGGNDYNGSGLVHPEKILADLISILHPEILPDHSLEYYRHIESGQK
jgi:iron complex transport system substrate-binding protein